MSSLSPASILSASTLNFPLTADGTGFLSGAQLLWKSNPRPTIVLSSTQVTATIPGTDIFSAGTAQVQVRNPDGGISNSLMFTISNPVGSGVTISSISPASGPVGVAVALTVQGLQNVNFPAFSQIFWNGVAQTTTGGNSSQLTATIAAGDVAPAGPIPVHVFAGGPGGGTSNTVSFAANNPLPTLATATPPNAVAGRPGPLLTIDGTGFVAGATVLQWNAVPLVTSVLSPTQLTAQALDADVRVAGRAFLQLLNPAPGGGPSNVLTYDINNPLPQITSISPVSVPFGSPALTITVNGTDFVESGPAASPSTASVVRWNLTTPLVTTFVNGATLTAVVPVALLAAPGTALVDVFNPLPRGGAAGGATFTIEAQGPFAVTDVVSLTALNQFGVGNSGTRTLALNQDGRYVAFHSTANLTNPPPAAGGGYLRDTQTRSTELTTVDSAGVPSAGGNLGVDMDVTPDGRFVAFFSSASDLVPNDPPGTPDVFVRDTCIGASAGCAPKTVRVSVDSSGVRLPDFFGAGPSSPSLSADGRYVAFRVVVAPLGQGQIMVHDRDADADGIFDEQAQAGAISTVTVSVNSSGVAADGDCRSPSLSADGRFVAFVVQATNLGAPPGTGRLAYVHDRDLDEDGVYDEITAPPVLPAIKTVIVSVDSNGNSPLLADTDQAAISADGRVVAFDNNGLILPGTTPGRIHVYAVDRDADGNGTFDRGPGERIETRLLSARPGGQEADDSSVNVSLGISADGRLVSFVSQARNLLSITEPILDADAFVAETCLGAGASAPCSVMVHRVSQRNATVKADAPSSGVDISGDGRRAVFSTASTNLVDVTGDGVPDSNGFLQVYTGNTGLQPVLSLTPLLTSLSPPSVIAGRREFILNVEGTDQFGAGFFSQDAVVMWNGSPRPTFYAGRRKLLVRIPAGDVATAGTAQITVFDPHSGATSSARTFTIQ